MSPSNDSSIPAQTSASNNDAPETISSSIDKGKFIAHMKQYPIVVSSKQEVMKLPYLTDIERFAAVHAKDVGSLYGISFVVSKTDALANGILDTVDRYLPGLKTLTPGDVTNTMTAPFVKMSTYTTKLSNDIHTFANENFTKPVIKIKTDVSGLVQSKVYNDQGKNILLTPVDPMVKPVNTNLDQYLLSSHPEVKRVPSGGNSSELHRTKAMLKNIWSQSKVEENANSNENNNA